MIKSLFRDLVAVEAPPKNEEMTTNFGLVLPSDNKSMKILSAKVVAVGPGRFMDRKKRKNFRPTVVKPGDVIAFGKSVAKEITVESKRYLVLREEDIFGIVE